MPTLSLFHDVGNASQLARREISGPVLAVVLFDDEADTLRIANNSEYGLAAGVWSKAWPEFCMSKDCTPGPFG